MKRLFIFALLGACCSLAAADAPGVSITTWQGDLQHTGANLSETILTPANVGSMRGFGFLFAQSVDGQVYGQPLIASGVNVSGASRNLVFVATEHDSVYAFDADDANGSTPVWQVSLLPKGAEPVPQSVTGSSDISMEVGVTATPAIDLATQTLYVLAKVYDATYGSIRQYLHALDLATGAEKFGGPVLVNPTFSGSATDGKNGIIPFDAQHEHSRAATIFYDGTVYLTFGSLSDIKPYHGEILGYDAKTLRLTRTFITTPDGTEGGVWQGGAGPAVDADGHLYVAVANGDWGSATQPGKPGANWGESFLKFDTHNTGAWQVSIADELNWFTPYDWDRLNENDLDLGSCGMLLLPDQAQGPHTHIMIGSGKEGVLYVVDRDDLGGIHNPDNVVQKVAEFNDCWLFATPAYFNGNIYYAPASGPLEQRAVHYDPVVGNYLATTPVISASTYPGKGAGAFISANGNRDGLVWLLNGFGIDAYDATNVSGAPIYSSRAIVPPDIVCRTPKFGLPTVANGKVYYAATDNDNVGHLFVYGLRSANAPPKTPVDFAATPVSSRKITLTWKEASSDEAGFIVRRALASSGPFETVATVGARVLSFSDTGLRANTSYSYEVISFNSQGQSDPTQIVTAGTMPFFTAPGLVAFWDFDDENSGVVIDVTGNGNNGRVDGEVVATSSIVGGGYTFHGIGTAPAHIVIPDKATLRFLPDQSFTLSAWIKPVHLNGVEQAVIAKSADKGAPYGIWINADNRWVFRGPTADLIGPRAMQGQWIHLAAVQDAVARTRKLYLNGQLVATLPGTQPADGPGDLWIGQQNVSGHLESFPGQIDEVRIYNRALEAKEVPSLLKAPAWANSDNDHN